jgi:hypothetical protein
MQLVGDSAWPHCRYFLGSRHIQRSVRAIFGAIAGANANAECAGAKRIGEGAEDQ